MVDSGCQEGSDQAVGDPTEAALVVAAAQSGEWSGRGPEDLHRTIADGLMPAGRVGQMLRGVACLGFRTGMDPSRHQTSEWWIADFLATPYLLGVELLIVVLRRQADRGVLGLKRLQDDFPRRVSPACTARHLSE